MEQRSDDLTHSLKLSSTNNSFPDPPEIHISQTQSTDIEQMNIEALKFDDGGIRGFFSGRKLGLIPLCIGIILLLIGMTVALIKHYNNDQDVNSPEFIGDDTNSPHLFTQKSASPHLLESLSPNTENPSDLPSNTPQSFVNPSNSPKTDNPSDPPQIIISDPPSELTDNRALNVFFEINHIWLYNRQTKQVQKNEKNMYGKHSCLYIDQIDSQIVYKPCDSNDDSQKWMISDDMIKSVKYDGQCIELFVCQFRWTTCTDLEVLGLIPCDSSGLKGQWGLYYPTNSPQSGSPQIAVPSNSPQTGSPAVNPLYQKHIKTQQTSMPRGEWTECIEVGDDPRRFGVDVRMDSCSETWSYDPKTKQIKSDFDVYRQEKGCWYVDREISFSFNDKWIKFDRCDSNDYRQKFEISGDMIESVNYNGNCIQIIFKDMENPILGVETCDNSNPDQKWIFY